MMKHIKIALLISLLALPFYKSYSQDEYVWEWGASIGGSYYMGDANWSKPFKHTGLAGGMMARRILNPHMAIKGNLPADPSTKARSMHDIVIHVDGENVPCRFISSP